MAGKHPGIKQLGMNHYLVRARFLERDTGRWLEIKREFHGGLKAALEFQLGLLEELAAPRRERQTVRDFCQLWLTGRLAKGLLKASSAKKIASVLDLHFLPRFGNCYLDTMKAVEVDRWLQDGLKHNQPVTVLGWLRVVRTVSRASAALTGCHDWTSGVEAPRYVPTGENVLRIDELTKVLEFLRYASPEWYACVLLMVSTGLRWGEVSALRWSDLDESTATVTVSKGNYKGLAVSSTKTGRARIVPLHPLVADALKEKRQQMVKVGHPGLSSGLIFSVRTSRGNASPGGMYHGNPALRPLRHACKVLGINRRVTVHGLRHTANDLLRRVATGEVTRAIVGHSSQAMTHHYSHVDGTEKRQAVDRMMDLVKPPEGKKDD